MWYGWHGGRREQCFILWSSTWGEMRSTFYWCSHLVLFFLLFFPLLSSPSGRVDGRIFQWVTYINVLQEHPNPLPSLSPAFCIKIRLAPALCWTNRPSQACFIPAHFRLRITCVVGRRQRLSTMSQLPGWIILLSDLRRNKQFLLNNKQVQFIMKQPKILVAFQDKTVTF